MSVGTAPLYGVTAEFREPGALLAAIREVRQAGYTRIEAYTPFSIEGLLEALGHRRAPVALVTLISGMIGGATGFLMCWYAFAVYYPINVGGRPNNSWPAWIPITFEMTVLFAAVIGTIAMLAMNGLPRLHHPIFEAPDFRRASRDRFFLCIEARDPQFDLFAVRELLASCDPLTIAEVAA